MALEQFQNIIIPFIDIPALIVAIFSVIVLVNIKKQKKKLDKKAILRIFIFISLGLLFAAGAELLWSTIHFSGGDPDSGFPDLFWVVGVALYLIGLILFSTHILKKKNNLKKGILWLVGVGIIVTGIVAYLIGSLIIGEQAGQTAFEIFLDYYYPIVSGLTIIATVSVYLFFKDLKVLGTPLLILAVGSLFAFAGDMLYTYISWNEIYGVLGILSDTMFAIDYMLSVVAFYLILKNWVGIKIFKS